MWSVQHRGEWSDLDAREEPTDAGRRLDAGGFVLADSFENVLRSISESYIRDAWQRLCGVLTRHHLAPPNLSWGWLHPGETHIVGLERVAPSDYVGWTSRELKHLDQDSRYQAVDVELQNGRPTLRCAVSWRSLKWKIAPDEYASGLRLIEALATDESTNWAPTWVIEHAATTAGAWIDMARAIHMLDQRALDRAVAQALITYTPVGYRIVLRGFASFIHQPGLSLPIQLRQEPPG